MILEQVIPGILWVGQNLDTVAAAGAAVAAGFAWIKRLQVLNHGDRLATLRDAAGTAAGRILLEANKFALSAASGESLHDFVQRRIREEGSSVSDEFQHTGAQVGLDADKMSSMITGELGKVASSLVQGIGR
ncbi:hypothetical protein [Roseococcus sp.]|uniref:hypothetical protein n=1 Tax=Roseococcus sp. TaxID=2109646 RepID=UPI003BA97303